IANILPTLLLGLGESITMYLPDNPNVADVDQNGVVTALSPGQTSIKVTNQQISFVVVNGIPMILSCYAPVLANVIVSNHNSCPQGVICGGIIDAETQTAPLHGIVVQLRNAQGAIIRNLSTDNIGLYSFTSISS